MVHFEKETEKIGFEEKFKWVAKTEAIFKNYSYLKKWDNL